MAISQRKYAEHRKAKGLPGTTHNAVAVAIKSGRLHESVTADGRIADAQLADREWEANTYSDRRPLTGPTSQPPPTKQPTKAATDGDYEMAHTILTGALVAVALEGADVTAARAYSERVRARLQVEAQQWRANRQALRIAWELFSDTIYDVTGFDDDDNDEPEEKQ